MAKKKYYVVKKGYKTGIFNTWSQCQEQTKGFSGAIFKSFENLDDANNFLNDTPKKIPSISEASFYVDGSYRKDTEEFSYGVVFIHNGKEEYFKEKFYDKELSSMRNVSGEIFGSMKAMEIALKKEIKCIDIYFDYEGIEKWALGYWKTNKQGTIDYKKFYDNIKNKLDVNFIKVKGHSGDKYNDIADRLAKEALGLI